MFKFKSLTYSDGIITDYIFQNGTLTLYFNDFHGGNYTLNFSGDVKYQDNDCKKYSICKAKLKKINGNRFHVEFQDDDYDVMLWIEYSNLEILQLD